MSYECPICKGSGDLPEPRLTGRDLVKERQAITRTLRDCGYSLRQIQDFLGWKSVRTVVHAIEASKASDLSSSPNTPV